MDANDSSTKSKAPVSQLVNAKVNGGNRKTALASNYVTRIRFVDAMSHFRNAFCIKLFAYLAKQLNYTRTLIPFDTRNNAKVEVYVL